MNGRLAKGESMLDTLGTGDEAHSRDSSGHASDHRPVPVRRKRRPRRVVLITVGPLFALVIVAVIGAVFAEQAGSNSGLGYVFTQALPQLLTARAFAAVVILSLFAIALFCALTLAERLTVPWAHSTGTELGETDR